ncbi:chemical-damaging agent resistance protein C [Spirochaetia bacterium]|nr:chemical-damaging agent resistance protein C [Spirochaetia bacterium]GHU34026.1 chemical-damaging agent resistance protein C [Spirochaetia bacterium]
MTINLQKGGKVDLTKTNPGLSKLIVGLGWDVNKYDGRGDFDLDASAFLLGANDRVTNEKDFIYYNNKKHTSGSVFSTGDNRTGKGEGDDEQIKVDLALVPTEIQRIDFTVTIYEADARRQNFGQVANAYIRIINENTKEELIRYDLGEDFSVETAIVVGELYRSGAEWKFSAIGSGFRGGLAALATNFGLSV